MSMGDWLNDRPAPPPQAPGFHEGKITHADPAGAYFKLNGFDDKHEFGPAPYTRVMYHAHDELGTHDHDTEPPGAGQTCLVVFAGPGIERPWVLAWW